MKFVQLALLASILQMASLLSSPIVPIKTDHAIFLFDNGEKNQIASMLKYAESHDKSKLNELDFRIVFMGASLDAMSQEPFCRYPEKLIHYKELGIDETIDRHWSRDKQISLQSLGNLCRHLHIEKKAWVGVSCLVFGQILERLQENQSLEVAALRDNPNLDGDTDYFQVAREVQCLANKLVLPSKESIEQDASHKQIVIVGHAPTEEWQEYAESLDKALIIDQLGLNSHCPIVVYAGVYGDYYENAFKHFLEMVRDESVALSDIQVLIVPHPRYKGIEEKRLCSSLSEKDRDRIFIVGEFEEEYSRRIKTVEALAIADIVITADATSTIVTQANTLRKKVIYMNPAPSKVSKALCNKGIIQKIDNPAEFLKIVQSVYASRNDLKAQPDIFQILGIPRNGARLLWEEFINPISF